MRIEFDDAGVKYDHQIRLPAYYKGRLLGEYRIDFIVDNLVVVEIKSVERMNPVFEAQLLTYLRVTAKPVGLLINHQLQFTLGERRRETVRFVTVDICVSSVPLWMFVSVPLCDDAVCAVTLSSEASATGQMDATPHSPGARYFRDRCLS